MHMSFTSGMIVIMLIFMVMFIFVLMIVLIFMVMRFGIVGCWCNLNHGWVFRYLCSDLFGWGFHLDDLFRDRGVFDRRRCFSDELLRRICRWLTGYKGKTTCREEQG